VLEVAIPPAPHIEMQNKELLWKFGKDDIAPALCILLLALAVAAPQLLGGLTADPMIYVGDMARGVTPGILPGMPYIDPNNGFGTQALGVRAALDWLNGTIPWWNPYSGVGLPLGAEYSPAAFFPPILLLLLPNGTVWLQICLQVLSGWGTYALLRQLGMGRLAAGTGGVLYAFNGTLAWFAHASALPVPFLPWLLLGIERAWVKSRLGLPGGWRLLALAMVLNLLAGFPETAYISGLLALAWAVLRGVYTERGRRVDYGLRIAAGGTVGIALAAPQILAFFHFLTEAHIAGHTDMALAALGPPAVIPTLLAPYAFGPIFALHAQWPLLANNWGGMGGYVTVALLVVAAYGFAVWRGPLRWLLLAWCVLALAKTFRLEPALTLWNLVPGVTFAAFARYAQPSWELALVILAAWGIDDLARSDVKRPGALKIAWGVAGIALAVGFFYGVRFWPHMGDFVRLRNWGLGSATWAVVTALACAALMQRAAPAWRARAIAALLVVDGVLMFAIPTLSNPRSGEVDMPAISFLRDNLGLQRFYTLGPIQPNYGALLGIASINHNYLPVSLRWVDWVREHLDRAADPVVFNGNFGRAPGEPSAAEELRKNLRAYEWAGVKYVVARGNDNPFAGMPGAQPRRVYADSLMSIYELVDPRPYFESTTGLCTLEPRGRTHVSAKCAGPETVVRRELFFPGWRATINAADIPISEHQGLFQSVDLPMGKSELRFDYAPPRIGWTWLIALLALVAWLFPNWRRQLRR
jgi:hypothetical protein